MRSSITTIAALVVAAALLAGCASSGAGGTSPPTSPVVAPSPAASPVPSPAAVTPTPVPTTDGAGPEHVVGTIPGARLDRSYTEKKVGEVLQMRDGVVAFGFDMNDPRVTGTATWDDVSVDIHGTLGPEWGPFRLENAGGSWEGSCSGGTWAEGDGAIDGCWLVGKGGYAGWTYFVQFEKEPGQPGTAAGIIYPGTPPKP